MQKRRRKKYVNLHEGKTDYRVEIELSAFQLLSKVNILDTVELDKQTMTLTKCKSEKKLKRKTC